jgi:hypothetical protein
VVSPHSPKGPRRFRSVYEAERARVRHLI